ncbi:hypothetical protein PCE1_003841 [Barthelona sp. PCE]
MNAFAEDVAITIGNPLYICVNGDELNFFVFEEFGEPPRQLNRIHNNCITYGPIRAEFFVGNGRITRIEVYSDGFSQILHFSGKFEFVAFPMLSGLCIFNGVKTFEIGHLARDEQIAVALECVAHVAMSDFTEIDLHPYLWDTFWENLFIPRNRNFDCLGCFSVTREDIILIRKRYLKLIYHHCDLISQDQATESICSMISRLERVFYNKHLLLNNVLGNGHDFDEVFAMGKDLFEKFFSKYFENREAEYFSAVLRLLTPVECIEVRPINHTNVEMDNIEDIEGSRRYSFRFEDLYPYGQQFLEQQAKIHHLEHLFNTGFDFTPNIQSLQLIVDGWRLHSVCIDHIRPDFSLDIFNFNQDVDRMWSITLLTQILSIMNTIHREGKCVVFLKHIGIFQEENPLLIGYCRAGFPLAGNYNMDYIAPECCIGHNVTPAADVFMIGWLIRNLLPGMLEEVVDACFVEAADRPTVAEIEKRLRP